jgi:hypothetical protein
MLFDLPALTVRAARAGLRARLRLVKRYLVRNGLTQVRRALTVSPSLVKASQVPTAISVT